MTRVLTLGTIVAVTCGALLGLTLAYGQWMLAMGALILGVGGAAVVALIAPEPAPTIAPVILGGPVVRPTVELDVELDNEPDARTGTVPVPDKAPEIPAPTPTLMPVDPNHKIPNAA